LKLNLNEWYSKGRRKWGAMYAKLCLSKINYAAKHCIYE
jgi:hypothetical protein